MGNIALGIVRAAGWLQDRVIGMLMPRLNKYQPPAGGAWNDVYTKSKGKPRTKRRPKAHKRHLSH